MTNTFNQQVPVSRVWRATHAIEEKYGQLGGPNSLLAQPITDVQVCPDGIGYFRVFQHGSIYWTPRVGAHEVHGAVRDKWEALGWERSFLGYPTTDETPFTEGGRVSVFEHGAIYWWPDVGAIALNEVVVHYTGFICFGETDWDQGSTSDEPYIVLGVVSPTSTPMTQIIMYNGVDAGESVPGLVEMYRGKPDGINISVLVMEHDENNPDRYKGAMEAAVSAAAAGITAGIAAIPGVGLVMAPIAAPFLIAGVPVVAEELNNVLDLGDDRIGAATLNVTAKQMVVLAARTDNSVERGIGFKLVTPLLCGAGASYKVYFGLVPA